MSEGLNILAVSDVHGKDKGIENLRELIEDKYDVLLILGDFTQFGPPFRARDILREVKGKGIKTLSLPGNCDPRDLLPILDEEGVNLHSSSHDFGDLSFVGFGGSNETPFDTPFEVPEEEIWRSLKDLIPHSDKNWILATHAPPSKTSADLTSDDNHVGSTSIRRVIEQEKPLINFCGHIHEAQSIDEIWGSKVINTGSISQGRAAEAVVRNGKVVKMELIRI